jgi:hypothetical protein
MARILGYPAAKAEALKPSKNQLSWLISSTLLMLSSIVSMWSHWSESLTCSAPIQPPAGLRLSRARASSFHGG